MSAQPQPRLTPEQYLELDRASEFRNEYYAGRMYATSGGTHTHAIIAGNFTSAIQSAVGARCIATQSDLRVQVSPSGLYTYPDIVVVCGEPQYHDNRKDTLANPILVAEVLSPSTEAYDRGFKSVQYRTLESLQEYVLVSQAEPRVEVFRRHSRGNWLLTESAGLEASCTLESLTCTLPLSGIYAQVIFPTEE
jgi:Uma2 family endonuclease